MPSFRMALDLVARLLLCEALDELSSEHCSISNASSAVVGADPRDAVCVGGVVAGPAP